MEGEMSTQDNKIVRLQKDVGKNEKSIQQVSQLHSILAEVKTEIKHINKKLDNKTLKDIIIETVVPAAIIGGILAFVMYGGV